MILLHNKNTACRTHPRSCHTFFCYWTLGTLAAVLQSIIGSVAAGSLFAAAQAVAMGAGVPIIVNVIVGVIIGVLGMVVKAFVCAVRFLGAE